MPNESNSDGGGDPEGKATEIRENITEMMALFFAQWGDAAKDLQRNSEERLARANDIVSALGGSIERITEISNTNSDIFRRSFDSLTDRITSIRADRDRLRDQLSESQQEVRRLTELSKGLSQIIIELSRTNTPSVSATIGDVTGGKG